MTGMLPAAIGRSIVPHMRQPFAVVALACAVAADAVGQDMIGVVWTGEVVHIDTRTMTTRTIGMGMFGQNALAVDGAGTIWSTSSTHWLTRIDPVTGAATIVYPTPDIRDLASNGTAMLWATVFTTSTTPNQLVRI